MLLAFKRDVSDGDALFAERFNHNLGLIWRHNFVFKSLKENDWARQSIGEVNRRAFDVKIATLRVRTDQPQRVTRFKLVRVFREGLGIANAIVARACFEDIAERQRAKRGVATGAAPADCQTIAVHQTTFREMARAIVGGLLAYKRQVEQGG